MDRLDDFRAVFAEAVTARAGCRDPRIKAAFTKVQRHDFVSPGPWVFSEHGAPTATSDPALLYQDLALGLAPERGITTGLPSLHARALDACALRAGDRVIHVGIGMGYYTALLAELVGPAGEVQAFEIDETLAAIAIQKLAPWTWVRVESRTGIGDLEPADVIYVCAGVQQIPLVWLRSLRPGGRLLIPLVPGRGQGGLLLVERREGGYDARFVSPASFIPCVGATDAEVAKSLAARFALGDLDSVHSLRLATQTPDESCWFAGDGWWLSTARVA